MKIKSVALENEYRLKYIFIFATEPCFAVCTSGTSFFYLCAQNNKKILKKKEKKFSAYLHHKSDLANKAFKRDYVT